MLDFYQIDWEYEPTSFVLERDSDGLPTQQFRPDFYLPEYKTYIEITTLSQRLVTKKNRKVRRLSELYPDIKCKIFYQRDYLNLLIKYGLEQPSQNESKNQSRAELPPGANADELIATGRKAAE